MALDTQAIVDQLKDASILELNDLVKAIEEEFNVTAAAPVAAAGAAAGADAEAKDSFTVELTDVGQEKVKVIKEVRAITGLGLKDAKGLVDAAPSSIKEDVATDDANKIKEQLEAVGATVTLK
ncbi:50S ribosomal protein L7/L12 [Lacticaseibacillus pabuli]|uniref:Large ribosomal subunit protein bL12 n=1 Tax=Lacticaseibacillus pabuli TaxID=3025672 RepID=A0ABY7WSM8_9LACO|nr:50S ribosomal protein L7/L12 [Lacticaseibacillus sp. KACC 23028]WDF83172.1 50S ribosomal protein L7/L12 [Lacticaseibacillus sp. KACC 23028]